MTEFVSDCPRCLALRSTHDVFSSVIVRIEYGWKQYAEIACICRNCKKFSVQLVSRLSSEAEINKFFGPVGSKNTVSSAHGSLNDLVEFERYITLRDRDTDPPPDHLPERILEVFQEANRCRSVGCWNAAAAMYRLTLDLATNGLLPEGAEPNMKTRRSLGLRLERLFDNRKIPLELKDLASCVREDGNDGAHDGSLKKIDAEDLHDFCCRLFDRMFSEPERLRIAADRRNQRRS